MPGKSLGSGQQYVYSYGASIFFILLEFIFGAGHFEGTGPVLEIVIRGSFVESKHFIRGQTLKEIYSNLGLLLIEVQQLHLHLILV